MNKKRFWLAVLIALMTLLLNSQPALAHESITVGDYTLVVGWLNEPPVVGQHNAIVVEVSTTSDEQALEDVASLTMTISYGGQDKTLTLELLDEHAPGQFAAPIIPTVPGQYTIHFGGTLGDTAMEADVEPEEVQPADTLQFPSTAPQAQSADLGTMNWLIYLSLLIGLVALVLGVMALRQPRG
jgi:hypothetical protein